jgi:hypothetical protein
MSDDDLPRSAAEWHARHGQRFNTDPHYRADAVAAHYRALAVGAIADTPSYFAELERELTEKYGADHGQRGSPRAHRQDSRDGETLDSAFGEIGVRRAGGKVAVSVPADVREEWEQAARACDMDLASYAKAQADIARENEGNIGRRLPRGGGNWR